jgi:hypothetical protein
VYKEDMELMAFVLQQPLDIQLNLPCLLPLQAAATNPTPKTKKYK